MSAVTAGFLLSVLGSVFYGLYMVPRKSSRLDTPTFVWVLSLSVALCCFVARLLAGQKPTTHPYDLWLAVFSGVLWFVGTVGYVEGVQLIGLTRSTPIKNLGPILVTVYGLAIFREYGLHEPLALAQAVLGSVLMTVAAVVFGNTSSSALTNRAAAYAPELPDHERKRLFRAGVLWSLVSAFGFSACSVPMKLVFRHMQGEAYFGSQAAVFAFLSSMGLSVGLSAVVYYMLKRPSELIPSGARWREWGSPALAGLLWVVATAAASTAILYIPLAVSWPISNLSTLVAVGLGIVWYREIHPRKHRKAIIWGMLTSAIGILLLGLATSQGHTS